MELEIGVFGAGKQPSGSMLGFTLRLGLGISRDLLSITSLSDGQSATGNASTVVVASTLNGFKILFSGSYTDKLKKVDGKWLFAERWVKVEPIPERPDFFAGSADPEIVELTKPLFEAFQRIGEKVRVKTDALLFGAH